MKRDHTLVRTMHDYVAEYLPFNVEYAEIRHYSGGACEASVCVNIDGKQYGIACKYRLIQEKTFAYGATAWHEVIMQEVINALKEYIKETCGL